MPARRTWSAAFPPDPIQNGDRSTTTGPPGVGGTGMSRTGVVTSRSGRYGPFLATASRSLPTSACALGWPFLAAFSIHSRAVASDLPTVSPFL